MTYTASIQRDFGKLAACGLLLALAACGSGEPEKQAGPANASPAASAQVRSDGTQAVTQLAEKTGQAAAEATEKAKRAAAEAGAEAAQAASQAKQAAMKVQAMKQNAAASQQFSEDLAASTSIARATAEKPAAAASNLVAGDAGKGEMVARKCAGCHYFTDRKKVGPGLKGMYGREAGSLPDFRYKFTEFIEPGKAWRWDDAHLAAWLCNSSEAVRKFTGNASAKTKMANQRICDPARQADLIAFLKTL